MTIYKLFIAIAMPKKLGLFFINNSQLRSIFRNKKKLFEFLFK